MKRFWLFLSGLVLLLGGGSYFFYQNIKPLATEEHFKDFLVTRGMGASQIGNKLQKEGLIRSALIFKIVVQMSGVASKIQAGEYRLSPKMSLLEIIDKLLGGPQEIWVTIPEGLRKEEIAERFASVLEKDQEFIQEFLSLADEGYLFPDTYIFPKTISASAVISKMKETFEAKTASLKPTREQVILASLIEREAKTDAERPIIAGILLNRVRIGMPLQVDATIQYAKNSWRPISPRDRNLDSPYNTYKFSGFPPAPIANPGLSSLEAAVNPARTDFFYYLHDSSGKVFYAKTLAEHNENIRRYLTD